MRRAPPVYSASQCAKVELQYNLLAIGEVRMNITTTGIDLAKTGFNPAGTDKHGRVTSAARLRRARPHAIDMWQLCLNRPEPGFREHL